MPRRNEPTTRTCIVTRAARPAGELIRFALDPADRVVADLRHRLPGRGVWVTATVASVAEAERKRLFARAFKQPVLVEPGLADRVGDQLRAAALSALSLARKAGALVLGFGKVEAALAKGGVAAVVEAFDAAEGGVGKIEAAIRRYRGPVAPRVVRTLGSEEMGLALGRTHVIHAALLADRASDYVLDQIAALARFYDREAQDDVRSQPSTMTADTAAGHSA